MIDLVIWAIPRDIFVLVFTFIVIVGLIVIASEFHKIKPCLEITIMFGIAIITILFIAISAPNTSFQMINITMLGK